MLDTSNASVGPDISSKLCFFFSDQLLPPSDPGAKGGNTSNQADLGSELGRGTYFFLPAAPL